MQYIFIRFVLWPENKEVRVRARRGRDFFGSQIWIMNLTSGTCCAKDHGIHLELEVNSTRCFFLGSAREKRSLLCGFPPSCCIESKILGSLEKKQCMKSLSLMSAGVMWCCFGAGRELPLRTTCGEGMWQSKQVNVWCADGARTFRTISSPPC